MRLVHRSVCAGVLAVLSTTVLTVGPAGAASGQIQSGHGQGYYGVWAYGVNVRDDNSDQCINYPSPSTCPTILATVSAPQQVLVWCQKIGESIGGNPYWVYLGDYGGWMASYFTDNETNWIDGVPYC